jgi:hypothetical protein
MPVPSEIQIKHYQAGSSAASAGADITDHVLFSQCRFDAMSGGGIGTFSLVLKDVERDLTFFHGDDIKTGDEIRLFLDGTLYFGGFVSQIGYTHAFPAMDTRVLGDVTARQFVLRGTNYNVLFDRLVGHNPDNHYAKLPSLPGTAIAGHLVTKLWEDYIDLNTTSMWDVTSKVDNVGQAQPHLDARWAWLNDGEQGLPARKNMEWISLYNGAIYYWDAQKRLHYHAPEKIFAPWGFSDRPNKRSVLVSQTGGPFMGATYGFRELDTTQDLTLIVNDIFVWGGSAAAAWVEGSDGFYFARRQNTVSQDNYGRWQLGVPLFGTLGTQNAVTSYAERVVPPNNSDEPPGVAGDGVILNRSKPSWNVKLTWFAHDVPTMNNGVKRHLIPGEVVTIILFVHGTGASKPLILTLPLRSVSVSFPTLPSNTGGDAMTFARFDGEFGLSLNDPFQLWRSIGEPATFQQRAPMGAGSPTTKGTPGAPWSGIPDELANGTRKTFTLSSNGTPIIYTALSSEVFVNSLKLRQGSDYQEAPTEGQITFFVAPPTGSTFGITVRLAG